MNKFVKRTIAGALIGGTIVSAGLGFHNLIKDGKFELIKNNNSLVKYHQLKTSTITPTSKNVNANYISSYDKNSSISNANVVEFTKPVGLEDNNIKIQNDTYYVDDLSKEQALVLINNLDQNNLDDMKALKSILSKMGAYKSDSFYKYITPDEYQKNYLEKEYEYNVTYYSYNQDYSKTKLYKIDSKDLESYNQNAKAQVAFGCISGAFVASAGTYLFSKQKQKRKSYR